MKDFIEHFKKYETILPKVKKLSVGKDVFRLHEKGKVENMKEEEINDSAHAFDGSMCFNAR